MARPENKVYRRLASKKDPRVCLNVPDEIYKELIRQAEKNARTKAEEIVARLMVTLKHNEEFMNHDRLMRLIYSKKLAYKGKGNKGFK